MSQLFRKYKKGDKETCLEIFDSNCPKYFATSERKDFSEWLGGEQAKDYYLILDGETTVGCGGIFIDEKSKEVGLAWGMIRSDYHGLGYGSSLLKFRLDLLRTLPPEFMKVVRTSQHTVHFFEKHGFLQIKNVKDGWGPGLDKIEMILADH